MTTFLLLCCPCLVAHRTSLGSGEVLGDSLAHLVGAIRENISVSRAQVGEDLIDSI